LLLHFFIGKVHKRRLQSGAIYCGQEGKDSNANVQLFVAKKNYDKTSRTGGYFCNFARTSYLSFCLAENCDLAVKEWFIHVYCLWFTLTQCALQVYKKKKKKITL